jgi:uncharacterized membrane protein HdeD (DUF308 family)
MLLDALSKIKRQSILTAILLMCLGIMLLLCPEEYITTLIILSGYIMIVYALEQTLEFLVNSTTTMSSILFIIAVVVGLVGLAVLVFHEDVLTVLSWIFGLLLMVDGIHSIYYAFTFAKRSGRKGWSILVILSSVLVVCGVALLTGSLVFTIYHFTKIVFLLRIIGFAILFSALVSGLRVIWLWPAKNGEGDESIIKENPEVVPEKISQESGEEGGEKNGEE